MTSKDLMKISNEPAATGAEERKRIVAFLRMIGKEVPPEQAAKLDRQKGSEVAKHTIDHTADSIESGMHGSWYELEGMIAALAKELGIEEED